MVPTWGANPDTEKPMPDAGIVVGAMTPTVPGIEKAARYGAVPPVMTKFDVALPQLVGAAFEYV